MIFTKKLFALILTVVLVLSFCTINISAADTYVVAGVESLCGSNWNANDTNNIMTYDSGFEYYKKDYFNVPANTYELKVVQNGKNWFGDSNGQNIKFEVLQPCTVTVFFDANTKEIRIVGFGVSLNVKFEYSDVAVVGSGVGSWLNGALWDPSVSSNFMTEVKKDFFEITYNNIPAGDYQFKFAFDGDWVHNFGLGDTFEPGAFCEAAYNGSNINIIMTSDYDVKITLDLRKFDYTTKTGALFKVDYLPVSSQPTTTPDTPSTTPSIAPSEKPGDNTESVPTIAPSQKPSQRPDDSEDNADTGDFADLGLTAIVSVVVLSALVFAITTLKRKVY